MKKSCSGCRVLNGDRCGLHYKTKRRGVVYGDLIPLEECPKPRTYAHALKLKDEQTAAAIANVRGQSC